MWDDPLLPDLAVLDSDKDTGLLHPNGKKIFRASQPIGFGRKPDRTYIIKDN